MITVVNEIKPESKVADWQPESQDFSLDFLICGMQDKSVIFCPSSGSTIVIFSEKPKKKLSELRGKITKLSEKEIDDQTSGLRNEWDRSI